MGKKGGGKGDKGEKRVKKGEKRGKKKRERGRAGLRREQLNKDGEKKHSPYTVLVIGNRERKATISIEKKGPSKGVYIDIYNYL